MCAVAQTGFNHVCIFETEARGFNVGMPVNSLIIKSKSSNPVKVRIIGSVFKPCLNY
jgi:hypothetical protein